jgi:membrane protein implicated in regulation of membrane protease activity
MNRAYLIVGVPAFITSFCWLAFGWGWRLAAIVTSLELIVVLAAVMYFLRRERARTGGPEGNR